MANVNKVILIGNLTRDPELRYTPSGTAVAQFGLAINRKYKGKNGEMQEEVCFVDMEAWARSAEIISEYCHRGDPLYVEGRLQYDTWEGRDGQKRSRLRVVAENFQFLSTRRGDSGAGPSEGGQESRPRSSRPPARPDRRPGPPPANEQPPPAEAEPPPADDDAGFQVNDDIPF